MDYILSLWSVLQNKAKQIQKKKEPNTTEQSSKTTN